MVKFLGGGSLSRLPAHFEKAALPYMEVMHTLMVVTSRVRYVSSGCFTSHRLSQMKLNSIETGPPVYRLYPRTLESVTVYRCQSQGSTLLFSSGPTAPMSGTQSSELTSPRVMVKLGRVVVWLGRVVVWLGRVVVWLGRVVV